MHRVSWLVCTILVASPATLLAQAQQQPQIPQQQVPPLNPIVGGQIRNGRAVLKAQVQMLPGGGLAQMAVPGAPGAGRETEFTDAITLPTDRQAKKRIEAAEDCIRDEDWGTASRLLQSLLDAQEDVFIQVKRKDVQGRETLQWTSVRSEANRLLAALPSKGLEFYELQYGTQARGLLNEAKKKGDPQVYGDIAQRFFHTRAGLEAAEILGTYHLDRGRWLLAELCFDRLLERQPLKQASPLLLLKATLAHRQTGNAERADRCWEALRDKVGREGMRLGEQVLNLNRLREAVDVRFPLVRSAFERDWPLYRGNPARVATGRGSVPILRSRLWQVSTLPDRGGNGNRALDMIKEALAATDGRLPGTFPLVVQGKVIYRTWYGVEAVDARTSELQWRAKSEVGIDPIFNDEHEVPKRVEILRWKDFYKSGGNLAILFENSTIGTLSSDEERVYAVDDLVMPPHPNQFGITQGLNQTQPFFGQLQEAAHQSQLVAIETSSGKLIWVKGDRTRDSSDLVGSYFLGPPLPLGGKLYVLTEKNGQLRLACLEARSGDVLWTQTLATARDKLLLDVGRRVQAVHLAYADGVLVCPTNAGAILGVDLLTHSLVWAHSYREASQGLPQRVPVQMLPGGNNPQLFNVPRGGGMFMTAAPLSAPDWKTSAPALERGRVVFAAPDGASVHCLNLRDGSLLWKEERKDDLYMAGVFQGKVLLIGKAMARALSLEDGKLLWRVETGMPSGQGVASGHFYYLPLRRGEVCRIDLEKGTVERGQSPNREEVPGNLVFFEDRVISQSETHLTAYEHVEAKLARAEQDLLKDARNPRALLERGELRLYQGNLNGAVVDLRQALELAPPADVTSRARSRLYEALTELLQSDWAAGEKYLDQFKDLSTVQIPSDLKGEDRQKYEIEQQRRQERFLCLVAKGREQQGRLVDAFRAYLDFSALASNRDLVTVIEDPALKARPDLWVQGRMTAMLSKATAEQRQQLEQEVATRWRALQDTQDVETLRRFVGAFGSLFIVGREAQLVLAERLLEEGILAESELHFRQLSARRDDPRLAAHGLYGLARLYTRKGLLEDAVACYRQLQREHAAVTLQDGRSVGQVMLDLAADKRFVLFLDEPAPALPEGTLKGAELALQTVGTRAVSMLEVRGEMPPSLQRYRLALVTQSQSGTATHQLALIEKDSGEDRWVHPLAHPMVLQNPVNQIRLPAYLQGHLLVFQNGIHVYAFDLLERKKLWERNLFGNEQLSGPTQQYFNLDADGTVVLVSNQGTLRRIGQLGPVTQTYVCLKTRDGLIALDPIRGTELWQKSDVTGHIEIFGDEQAVYVVEIRDGRVSSARAYNGQDGSALRVPDFVPLFTNRIRTLGGRLLVSEPHAAGKRVRLYDVRTGKDLWTQDLPADSILLTSDDPQFIGILDKEGRVVVVDLNSLETLTCTGIRPDHLGKDVTGLLIMDQGLLYVALNRSAAGNPNMVGGPWSNLEGLRNVFINGYLYAFDRKTGAIRWRTLEPIEKQFMVLDQLQDVPMLLFTAFGPEQIANNRQQNVIRILSVDKRTGKLLLDRQSRSIPSSFFQLRINRPQGTFDLVGRTMTVRHTLEPHGR